MMDMQEQPVEEVEVVVEPTEDAPKIETEQPDATPEPESPTWAAEDEEEARLFGWKPPSEWQGDMPKGYIDNPDDYLSRVKRSKIFTTMTEKLETTTKGLEQVSQMALRRQKEQHEAALEAARNERDAAFDIGDADAYKAANEREKTLLSQPTGAEQPSVAPEVEAYRNSEAGAWTQNPILSQTAAQLVQANPAILASPPAEQIAYAEREMRKMYPAYFPERKATPKPAPRQVVDGGGLGGAGGRSAFDKLPSDAKQAFSRFVREGIFEDTPAGRKEYSDEYNK